MTPEQPICFAGSAFGEYRHVCAFFHTQDEEYRVLLPFIKEGIDRGEKAFHAVDPKLREDHLSRLRLAGIDVASAEQRGQLEVKRWEEAYLRGGHFDQDAMLALVQEVLNSGPARGYTLTRLVAHMEWALEDRPGANDVVEYEMRLNCILPKYQDVVVCIYDCARFGAGIVMDALRTHPMVIIGGLLQENPFFVPPDKFLLELRERGAYRHGLGKSA